MQVSLLRRFSGVGQRFMMWPRDVIELTRKPKPHLPACVRDVTAWYRRVSNLFMVVIVVGACRIFLSAEGIVVTDTPLYWLAATLGIGLSCHVPVLLARRKISLMLIEVGRKNYKVCASCGYDLTGLAHESRCPECGCSYDLHQLKELWEGLRFS